MQNCPICKTNLSKVPKHNLVLVCPSCNNSLFVYKDKKNQLKYLPFSLKMHFKGQISQENQGFEDLEEFEEDVIDPEDSEVGEGF